MQAKVPIHIKSVTEYHNLRGLPKPEHPLISVIHLDELEQLKSMQTSWVLCIIICLRTENTCNILMF